MTVRRRHDTRLGCEREPGAPRRSDGCGDPDSERVDPQARERDRDLPTVDGIVHHVRDDALDTTEVSRRERREAHLVVTSAPQTLGDHRAHLRLRTFAYRARDHARLAEATPAGAAAEHLDVQSIVYDFGQRDELVARVGPVREVGDRALHNRLGHVRVAWCHRHEPLTVVLDVVHRRHVHAGDRREVVEHALARAGGAAARLPRPHDVGDLGDDLFAVADGEPIHEVGERLGVVRAVPPAPMSG